MPRSRVASTEYLTTFNVAKLLGVTPPTVVNWIDAGILHAHRTPGGHRRVAAKDLIVFARAHAYPLPVGFGVEDKPRRILVVDDQREFTSVVVEYLHTSGAWITEVADSGFAAGLAVAQFKPDIILLDIRMPDVNGFEVLARLKADEATRHIPVVACTGDKDPGLVAQVRASEFVALVEKPVRLKRLEELLEVWLDEARAG